MLCFQAWKMASYRVQAPLLSHQLSAGTLRAPLELRCTLNDVISGSSKASDSEWELHLAAHKTSVSGAEILLTKAQFRI